MVLTAYLTFSLQQISKCLKKKVYKRRLLTSKGNNWNHKLLLLFCGSKDEKSGNHCIGPVQCVPRRPNRD